MADHKTRPLLMCEFIISYYRLLRCHQWLLATMEQENQYKSCKKYNPCNRSAPVLLLKMERMSGGTSCAGLRRRKREREERKKNKKEMSVEKSLP